MDMQPDIRQKAVRQRDRETERQEFRLTRLGAGVL
jgi:hypothetical protein